MGESEVQQRSEIRRATELTCARGVAHFVTATALADGLAGEHGDFVGLCGHSFHAAAMITPPGVLCAECNAVRTLRNVVTSTATGRHARQSLLHRCARFLRRRLFLQPEDFDPYLPVRFISGNRKGRE